MSELLFLGVFSLTFGVIRESGASFNY